MADLRRNYSQKTLKVLFALSGNQCAHPECTNTVVEPATEESDYHVSAHICHIYAISAEGPRGKPGLTEKELNAPDNLILLCSHHHGIVDGQHETYPADTLKAWKWAHEAEIEKRLSADLEAVPPNLFSHSYFPTALIDQKIEDEVENLRKTRFFAEVDRTRNALVLGSRIVEGELSGGSDAVRSRALAWCARILSPSESLKEAEKYLEVAKRLGACTEIEIAAAFIVSQKGDKEAALKSLAPIDSPSARSAALMVVAHHEGAGDAIGWLKCAGVEADALDPDGKFFLLRKQLELAWWDAARETVDTVSEEDLAKAPVLYHITAITWLISAVPVEFRSVVLNHLPLDAAKFPLASDAPAMDARKTAHRRFAEAAEAARQLKCPRVATVDDEYALWLELRNPETAAEGRERLEVNLHDPKSALQLVPLGLDFGITFDISAVEQEIEQHIALHGGITPEAAIARFAITLKQKTPQEVVSHIDRNYDDLTRFLDSKFIGAIKIEALSRAGMSERAERCLSLLLQDGLSEDDEERLSKTIAEAAGADPVELRKEQFRKTDALRDLLALVDELQARQNWEELCEFGEILFQRTRSVADAERLANALTSAQESGRLVELLSALPDLREQSRNLQMFYCWSLYDEGQLIEARSELASLSDNPDDPKYRALVINLGIALGDWASLSAFVATEYQARDRRTSQELIQAAQLAHHLGSPRARDLTFAAATKGVDDPGVLAAAYFLATTAGWEDDETVVSWIHRAAELSGDHGPIQKMTLKDLAARKPDWDRRESEIWKMLSRAEIPIFLAGESLNKSLVNLMLFPALANLSERDPRRRGAIPAYSGQRRPLPLDTANTTVGLDATALLTLSFLNLLDKALDAFKTVYVPHSTLSWLFEEKQRAAFHQPSRIRDARKIRDLLVTDLLEKLVPSAVADSDLCAQVGDDLATLIAEAEKVSDDDKTQRIVVRPSPVPRVTSLMAEEAELTEHAHVICGCLAVVEKLRQKGQITADEEKNARAYLQLHEKPWPQQLDISDGAVLYLDNLAISYFLHLGILEKLKAAGFAAVVAPSTISESNALISYESIADKVNEAIERIRSALNHRIESGIIRFGKQRTLYEPEEQSLANHPTAGALALVGDCDAVIIDDRFVNQHTNVNEADAKAAISSTLDLLDGLVSAGAISSDEWMEFRTLLRCGGYFFIPVRKDELIQHLNACWVTDGELIETAELKAIRENLLHVRLSDWLQLPKEAPWLDTTIKVFIVVLKELWRSGADLYKAKAISDWIVKQIDVRGWVHFLGTDIEDDVVKTAWEAHIFMLLTPPLDVPQEVKGEYWEWVEGRVLAEIKEQFPELYDRIVELQKQQISELADMDLSQGAKR